MKRIKFLALFLATIMCVTLFMTSCKGKENEPPVEVDPPVVEEPIAEGFQRVEVILATSQSIEGYGLWLWYDGAGGQCYLFEENSVGGRITIDVSTSVSSVNLIVLKNCKESEEGSTSWGTWAKDGGDGAPDRVFALKGESKTTSTAYYKPGDFNLYSSQDGGVTLEMVKSIAKADLATQNTIEYAVIPSVTIGALSDVVIQDSLGNQVAVSNVSTLGTSAATGVITTSAELDISKVYTLTISGFGSKEVIPSKIFDSTWFANNYVTSDSETLGAIVDGGSTTFKVWAPTASDVKLVTYASASGDANADIQMTKGAKGVWSYTGAISTGTYYNYKVSTAVGTQIAVDPYAKSTNANGQRGMVCDMNSAATIPSATWATSKYYAAAGTATENDFKNYTDANIWEMHIRDFSVYGSSQSTTNTSPFQNKGKFLALTETGVKNSSNETIGMPYVKNLGITHIHLLPSYDYASVDETKDNQFNWGYDPQNYNVPEGSYSTNANNGYTRVKEFRQAIESVHNQGLGVVMDVVYNHTYDKNSSLNKVVPYYYYRMTSDGKYSNGSGCGNETASERAMFRKYMVDSVVYWATEYKVDGFRFDLMGLHDLQTMQEIERAVHAINKKALIYGEGWQGMSAIPSGNGTSSLEASQANIKSLTTTSGAAGSIAVFNDAMRDGVKGSYSTTAAKGYVNGDPSADNTAKIIFGVSGATGAGASWKTNSPNQNVNYTSAHDNNTLYDKLMLSMPSATNEQRLKAYRLSAAIVFTSQGLTFMQAGEEMLRSKVYTDADNKTCYDENSYMSSDAVNNINWEAYKQGSDAYNMSNYYKGLMEFRKAHPALKNVAGYKATAGNSATTSKIGTVIGSSSIKNAIYNIIDTPSETIVMVYNPYAKEFNFTLGGSAGAGTFASGSYSLFVDDTTAGATPIRTGINLMSGCTIPANSCMAFVKSK